MGCGLDPLIAIMITFSSSCLAIFDLVGCCTVISLWVWSSLIGGCGLPLIFVSESWSLCVCAKKSAKKERKQVTECLQNLYQSVAIHLKCVLLVLL